MGQSLLRGQAFEAAEESAEDADPNSYANIGQRTDTLGCSGRLGAHDGNTRVNQDCSYRRQAEEKITFNPANHNNLLAGQNESRVGFNQCGIAWSTDGGKTWGDLLPPFRQRLNNPAGMEPTQADPNRRTILGGPDTLHTCDFASDPGPAFDSQGRGFFSCEALDVKLERFNALGSAVAPRGAGFILLKHRRRGA